MSTFVLALGLWGCASPEQDAAVAYVRAIEPLLIENSALADEVLVLGAGVYNESAGSADVAAGFEKRVVPMSEHLAQQAAFVAPPPPFADTHAALVDIWTQRAGTYRVMAEATRTANVAVWNQARTRADEVRASESRFFVDLNRKLSPWSLQVDPYP